MGYRKKFLQGFFQKKRLLLKSSMKTDQSDDEKLEDYYTRKMDELLDKINKYGHDSLTKREKKLLKEAGKFLEKKDKN